MYFFKNILILKRTISMFFYGKKYKKILSKIKKIGYNKSIINKKRYYFILIKFYFGILSKIRKEGGVFMKTNAQKIGFLTLFSVASVWFGSHAGGGFATGNQATQYFVQYGWFAPIAAVVSMAILGLVLREIVIMTNNHGFTTYKQVFEELYAPYIKLELIFELFFFIVALSATGAAIAGAATLFTQYGINYTAAVIGVSILLFFLTIFGSALVAKASTIMSICILICCAIIFFLGIRAKMENIAALPQIQPATGNAVFPVLKVLSYAGFQVLCAPALIGCAAPLKNHKNASKCIIIGFIMNAFALGASCLMLNGWYGDYTAAGKTALPTLYVCEQLGYPFLSYCYSISLFMCFISTGVTSIFGLVPRFEKAKVFSKWKSQKKKRALISLTALIVSTLISMVGLTNIVNYGYVYSGYLSVVFIVIPILTVGYYKNRKFLKEHGALELHENKKILVKNAEE